MAKEVIVACPQDGADKGKTFRIKRMSAIKADQWGRHVFQAAASSGGNIAGLQRGGGLAEVAAAGIGIFAAMDPAKMDELIAQLLEQVEYLPDPSNHAVTMSVVQADAAEQIEEVPTIGWLQSEAFKLHVDFFKGVGPLFSLIKLMLGAGESSEHTPA